MVLLLLTLRDENDQGMDYSSGYFSKFHAKQTFLKQCRNLSEQYNQFVGSIWLNASAFHPAFYGI